MKNKLIMNISEIGNDNGNSRIEHKKLSRKYKFCNVWLSNPELETWMKKFNNTKLYILFLIRFLQLEETMNY